MTLPFSGLSGTRKAVVLLAVVTMLVTGVSLATTFLSPQANPAAPVQPTVIAVGAACFLACMALAVMQAVRTGGLTLEGTGRDRRQMPRFLYVLTNLIGLAAVGLVFGGILLPDAGFFDAAADVHRLRFHSAWAVVAATAAVHFAWLIPDGTSPDGEPTAI